MNQLVVLDGSIAARSEQPAVSGWPATEAGDLAAVAARNVVVLYSPLPEVTLGHMTLAIGICAQEAILMIADGRVSSPALGGLAKHTDHAEKLVSLGPFVIAAAGFKGLTDEILRRLAEQGTLTGCPDVHAGKEALENFVRGYMERFHRTPKDERPSCSFMIGGYGKDGIESHLYTLHSGKDFQSAAFNTIGTGAGCATADALALLVWEKGWGHRPSLEQAKQLGALAIQIATEMDATVGPPVQMALITRERGYEDISEELPDLVRRSADAVMRIRTAFSVGAP